MNHNWTWKKTCGIVFLDIWYELSLAVELTVSPSIFDKVLKHAKSPQNVQVIGRYDRRHLHQAFLRGGMLPVLLLSSQFHFNSWQWAQPKWKAPQNVQLRGGHGRRYLPKGFLRGGMIPVLWLSSQFHFQTFSTLTVSITKEKSSTECATQRWTWKRAST